MSAAYSIEFQPKGSSAVNDSLAIRICQPRISPARYEHEIEFDYGMYINNFRLGLGFLGFYLESKDRTSADITLVVGPASVIDDLLALKNKTTYTGDNFSFFISIVNGLLQVFASGYGVSRKTRYAVAAKRSALCEKFPEQFANASDLTTEYVLLGDLTVGASGEVAQ